MSIAKDLADCHRQNIEPGFVPQSKRIVGSDLDDMMTIYGGLNNLEEAVEKAICDGFRNIFVVTTCVPGIIGDDCAALLSRLSAKHNEVSIRLVNSYGNMTGDFNRGFVDSAKMLLEFVDSSIEPKRDTVNILAERYFFKSGNISDDASVRMLERFGLKVNSRFLYRSNLDSIRQMRGASINFIVDNDNVTAELADILNEMGMYVGPTPLPVGIHAMREFAEFIGKWTGDADKASEVYRSEYDRYRNEIDESRRILRGRRVILVDMYLQGIEWMLELLQDLGTKIVRLGLGHSVNEPELSYCERDVIRRSYTVSELVYDIKTLEPDLVIVDSGLMGVGMVPQVRFNRPCPGIDGVLEYAMRIRDAVIGPAVEGWRCIEWE